MTKLRSVLLVVMLMFTVTTFGQTYEDVVAKFNEGADGINKGEFALAISDFQEVLMMAETVGSEADDLASKSKQQIPLLNYQAAIGFMKQKDYENAIPYLQKTVDFAEAYNNNAEYKTKALRYLPQLLTGVGTKRIKSDDCEGALEMFKSAVKYSPNYAKAHLGLGLCYKANYEEDDMIGSLTKAIELAQAKNDAKTIKDAQEALGGYFVEVGKMELEDMDPAAEDFEYAIEAFERAIEFNPENTDANYQLAVLNNRMTEYDLAIGFCKKALEQESVEIKIAAINYELGNAYNGIDEYDLACEAFKKAMVGLFEEKAIAKIDRIGCY